MRKIRMAKKEFDPALIFTIHLFTVDNAAYCLWMKSDKILAVDLIKFFERKSYTVLSFVFPYL